MTQEITSHPASFWRKSRGERLQAFRYRFKQGFWNRVCPRIPLPTRLAFGGWWLAGNDLLSDAIFARFFDGPDVRFLNRFVRAGTTVVDIGAHTGFYTLLMSSKVGDSGRVLAFEPSPREFSGLLTHIRINRRANIQPVNVALGDQAGNMELFITRAPGTTGNSLHRPQINCSSSVRVPVVTLDAYLEERNLREIDLLKLDAEGAELKILQGAERLLSGPSRPLILCEVNDPVLDLYGWEHRGQDVLELLEGKGFRWHALDAEGNLKTFVKASSYSTDLLAVPEERAAAFAAAER